jgi:hypothetical protein
MDATRQFAHLRHSKKKEFACFPILVARYALPMPSLELKLANLAADITHRV